MSKFPALPWPVIAAMAIGCLILLIAHGISVKIEQNKKEKENEVK